MSKYGYTFDPFKLTGVNVPRSRREDALDAVANYLKESALSEIGASRSPVSGGPWKSSLSPEYKKVKGQESSTVKPNLELHGDLLDALDVNAVSMNRIFYGVSGDQAGKAEGNNIGSYGREPDEGKARRFIPLDGEKFKKPIVDGMRAILREFEDEE